MNKISRDAKVSLAWYFWCWLSTGAFLVKAHVDIYIVAAVLQALMAIAFIVLAVDERRHG